MKPNSQFVSIIMSVYNETDNMLIEAIESIINQTYKNFEYIIVLDNPNNEDAKKVLLKYKEQDNRIVFVENEKNIGLPLSLNRGLKLSKFDLVARMDADDISLPTRIEKQVRFFERNPNVDLISSQIEYIDEDGHFIEKTKPKITSEKIIYKILPYSNPFTHPAWMFRKKILKKLIGYRNIPSGQDYDFLLRAKSHGYKLKIMEDTLLNYRVRNSSISVSKKTLQQKMTLYIQKLYFQRMRNGKDTFDENYIAGIENRKDYLRYKKSADMYLNYKSSINNRQFVKAFFQLMWSLIYSKDQCKSIYNAIMVKIILKK